MNKTQAIHAAETHLGYCARLISQSKSGYRTMFPDHLAIFNANVCTKEHGKIWYGDIDLTLDEQKLKALAKEIGCLVFVLREMDGRFGNEAKPLFDHAVYCVNPTTENP